MDKTTAAESDFLALPDFLNRQVGDWESPLPPWPVTGTVTAPVEARPRNLTERDLAAIAEIESRSRARIAGMTAGREAKKVDQKAMAAGKVWDARRGCWTQPTKYGINPTRLAMGEKEIPKPGPVVPPGATNFFGDT